MNASAELAAYLRARDAAEPGVAPGMQSLVLPGRSGAGAIVLLHGLTASPPAWRALAAELHARGRTVIVPRLPLHGYDDRMTRALRGLRTQTLLDDVRELIGAAAALGEPLTVAGHSLGAALALAAGARNASIARVVAIAPFLSIVGVPRRLHASVRTAIGLLPDIFLWWDPRLRERLGPEHGYPRYPLAALYAGLGVADYAGAFARPAAASTAFVLNAGETAVNNRTAARLAARWQAAGADVRVHRLAGLGWSHDIIEPDRAPARRAHRELLAVIEGDSSPSTGGESGV